jgi:hypothetical protein
VVYTQNGVPSSQKYNETKSSAGKQIKLDIIMLSKVVSQTQKDKYHMFSHMQNLILKNELQEWKKRMFGRGRVRREGDVAGAEYVG